MKRLFLLLFFLLLASIFVVPCLGDAYRYDYIIYYDDVRGEWLALDEWGSELYSNVDFHDTWDDVYALSIDGDRIAVKDDVTFTETLTISKRLEMLFDNVSVEGDITAFHFNQTTLPSYGSLRVQYLNGDADSLTNGTALIILEDTTFYKINIGLLDVSGAYANGTGVLIWSPSSMGCMGNEITLRDTYNLHTAVKFLAEGEGWITENTIHKSSLSGGRIVNLNITQTGTGGIGANLFENVLFNNAYFGVWAEGARPSNYGVEHNLFLYCNFWDWGNPPLDTANIKVYHANANVTGTIFLGGMLRTETVAFWDDNGKDTNIVGGYDIVSRDFVYVGLPETTVSPSEGTDDKTLIIEFFIVLAIVGILGGALGLRRWL